MKVSNLLLMCMCFWFLTDVTGNEICAWKFDGDASVKSVFFPVNHEKARATIGYDPEMKAPGETNGSLKISIEQSGPLNSIPVCFQRTDPIIKKGRRYRIDLAVRSSSAGWICVQAIEGFAPWRLLGGNARENFQVPADEWKNLRLEFTAAQDTSAKVRIPTVYLGKLAVCADFWIAKCVFSEIPVGKQPAKAEPDSTPLWQVSAQVPPMKPPAELRKWGYADAWKQTDGARRKISLCNIWDIAPVETAAEPPPAAPDRWKYFIVPGHWKGGSISNFIRMDDGRALEQWNGKKIVSNVHHAWYRRTVDIPETLRDKALFLTFERIDEGGEIRLNGKTLATVRPMPPERVRIPVNDIVKFGELNEILVRVDSPGLRNKSKGGLMGAVWLETLPKSNIGEPEIRTLLGERKLKVDFHDVSNISGGTLRLALRDAADNKVVLIREIPWSESVSIDCEAPKLWSPDSPNLYYLDFEWRDAEGKLTDRCSRRFGFREFRVSGKNFLLNGSPVLLRADTDLMKIVWTTDWYMNPEHARREFRLMKQFRINTLYIDNSQPEALADVADEEGILLLTMHTYPYKFLEKSSDETILEMLEEQLGRIKKEKKFYNHPSRIAWLIDVWFNFHNGATNGEYVGLKYGTKSYPAFSADGRIVAKSNPDPNLAQPMRLARMKRLNRMAELFRKYFPDMATFTGGSGEVNGIYSTHIYHTWGAPREELRALFSRYALQPELPIFIGEHNIPYAGSYYPLAQPYSPMAGNTPLFMENAARDAGHRAYRFPPVHTRRPLHGWGAGSLQDGIHDKDPWHSYSLYSPLYLDALIRNIEALIPAWRACGVNGFGMFGYVYNNFLQAGHRISSYDTISGDISTPFFKPEVLAGGKAPWGLIHSVRIRTSVRLMPQSRFCKQWMTPSAAFSRTAKTSSSRIMSISPVPNSLKRCW